MARISFDSTRHLILHSLEVGGINPNTAQTISVGLDTGASITSIPIQVATDLGYDLSNPKQEVDILTTNGTITAKIITVRNLTAIGETVDNIDVLCHDLHEDSIVEGLLGLNFLQYLILLSCFRQKQLNFTQYNLLLRHQNDKQTQHSLSPCRSNPCLFIASIW